jgi:4-alpha-glucanotransferase
VNSLRDQFELPGMKVLQFAFSGMDNVFLPHHYPENCVVYTGTHDNDTALGWYASAPDGEKDFAHEYLKLGARTKTDAQIEHKFVQALTEAAWSSKAVFCLAPMQDWLELGTEARMNYPSRLGGNWEWRMENDAMNSELQERIRMLNWKSGR